MALKRCLSKDVEGFVSTPPGSTLDAFKVLINKLTFQIRFLSIDYLGNDLQLSTSPIWITIEKSE